MSLGVVHPVHLHSGAFSVALLTLPNGGEVGILTKVRNGNLKKVVALEEIGVLVRKQSLYLL